MAEPQERITELLRGRGLRVTAQRRAVLTALMAEPSLHLTAGELLRRVHDSMPEMSKATVYKALDDERRAGLIDEHADETGTHLYGLHLEPHDHFVCERCGRWLDVPPLGRPTHPERFVEVGMVAQVEVLYRGLCRTCAEEMAAAR
jgi:Fe2+ or Zn2+ uptake regulation protein